jgi:sugar phosphate isomerase/epimerase
VARFKRALDEHGLVVPMATTNLFTDPVFKDGAFTSADARVRHYALHKTMRAIDLGVELGASTYVFWGGREGAEVDAGGKLLDALSGTATRSTTCATTSRDQGYDLRFALEPKPNEPRGHAFLPTVGSALGFIATLEHPEMVGLNPEFAHETMAGLSFPHALAAAIDAGKLFHVDLNDQVMAASTRTCASAPRTSRRVLHGHAARGALRRPAALRRARAAHRGRGGVWAFAPAACAPTSCSPRRCAASRPTPRSRRPWPRTASTTPRARGRRATTPRTPTRSRRALRSRAAAPARPGARAPRPAHRRDAARGALMRDLVLGVDLGTSGVGVVAQDAEGRVHARADTPLPLETPQPGWTQQDPDDWRRPPRRPREVARAVGGERVAAIALSGQMHGMVARDGRSRVHPALLWNDQRTARRSTRSTSASGRERLIERTGNPPSPASSSRRCCGCGATSPRRSRTALRACCRRTTSACT